VSVFLNATSVNNRTHQPAPVAERYGMLKVLLFVPKKGWLCKCDCGKERYIEGNHLRNFKYMSCGCNARKHQSDKLKATLRSRKVTLKQEVPKPTRYVSHGSSCWVCRNKTGTNDAVALCAVCARGCI